MSYDPNCISDRMDMEPDYPTCQRCKGRGYTFYERGNPYACEPCGCDEADDEEE